MAFTPEDEAREAEAAALFEALREDTVQAALDGLEADTGLSRQRVIAEAVVFAQAERSAFMAYLRGRGPRRRVAGPDRPGRGFLSENAAQLLAAGMFLLGAALAAIQILLR